MYDSTANAIICQETPTPDIDESQARAAGATQSGGLTRSPKHETMAFDR